jgi:hypothetical protein
VQTARARAGQILAGAPLDNGNVDARQRQLARRHQPRRTSSGDHHRMIGHSHTPAGSVDSNTRISHLPIPQILAWGQRLCGTPRGLKQAPLGGIK